jgi:hypothetical protein
LSLTEEDNGKLLDDDKYIEKDTKIIVLRQTLKKTQGLLEDVHIKNNEENAGEKNYNFIEDTYIPNSLKTSITTNK